MLVVGMFKIGAHGTAISPANAWPSNPVQEGSPFWWIYQYGLVPLTATMFAMLAFYIASAAFRAFRAKNVEATLLLGTAFIVLLGQVYAGYWMTDFLPDQTWLVENGKEDSIWYQFLRGLRLENLTQMIMDVPVHKIDELILFVTVQRTSLCRCGVLPTACRESAGSVQGTTATIRSFNRRTTSSFTAK